MPEGNLVDVGLVSATVTTTATAAAATVATTATAAATVTTTTTAATVATEATTTATATAVFTRLSLFHDDLTTVKFRLVQVFDSVTSFIVVRHFYKPETFRTSGFTVHDDFHAGHFAEFFEGFF